MPLLSLAPLIIERLKDRCPLVGGKVFAADDLAGVQESTQVAPALHVLIGDYTPVETVGSETRWLETWLVVTVVKNSARKDRAAKQAEAAMPILEQVTAALSGWHPGYPAAQGCLQFVPGIRPANSATHGYYPLAVQVPVVTGAKQ